MSDVKRIAFRVDASITLGAGHVMRCLALAEDLKQQGIQSIFICRAHAGHLADKVKAAGHTVHLLPLIASNTAPHFKVHLGNTITEDAIETSGIVNAVMPQWLVLDHYEIDEAWQIAFKQQDKHAIKLLVIDGQANRRHLCDALLDPTYHPQGAKRWEALLSRDCKLFVGPQYAPLRTAFKAAAVALQTQAKPVVKNGLTRVLLAFGAVDAPNATQAVLATLLDLNHKNIVFDVVLGDKNPNLSMLKATYQHHENVVLHIDPPAIVNVFLQTHFALVAGGSTVWELCSLAKPMLIVSIADNQIGLAKNLDQAGCAIYIGALMQLNQSELVKSKLKNSFNTMLENTDLVAEMGEKARRLMGYPSDALIQFLQNKT